MKAVAKEQMVTREVLSASQRRAAIKRAPRPVYKPYLPIRFEDQARVLLDAKVPAFSFIYGIPPKEILGGMPDEKHRHDWGGDHTR